MSQTIITHVTFADLLYLSEIFGTYLGEVSETYSIEPPGYIIINGNLWAIPDWLELWFQEQEKKIWDTPMYSADHRGIACPACGSIYSGNCIECGK